MASYNDTQLKPSNATWFREGLTGLDGSRKIPSEASPGIGQVALLGLLFCLKGKGSQRRCFGHPIASTSTSGDSGMRELRKWLNKRGHKSIVGNPGVICEVSMIKRTRKGGKRVYGTIKKCYRAPSNMETIYEMDDLG